MCWKTGEKWANQNVAPKHSPVHFFTLSIHLHTSYDFLFLSLSLSLPSWLLFLPTYLFTLNVHLFTNPKRFTGKRETLASVCMQSRWLHHHQLELGCRHTDRVEESGKSGCKLNWVKCIWKYKATHTDSQWTDQTDITDWIMSIWIKAHLLHCATTTTTPAGCWDRLAGRQAVSATHESQKKCVCVKMSERESNKECRIAEKIYNSLTVW